MRRFLSAMLLALGTSSSLIGLIAFFLSRTQNHQLQLVAASFDAPSRFWLVNIVNALFAFSIRQSVQVLALGIVLMVVGGWLVAHFEEEPRRKKRRRDF